jgi:hypothetical protein
VCALAKLDFPGAKIAGLPADNAAAHVARRAAEQLEDKVLFMRDLCHCVDLLSKDASSLPTVQEVLKIAKKIFDFCRIDRINCIRKESIYDGSLEETNSIMNYSDTRMNNVHDHINSAL